MGREQDPGADYGYDLVHEEVRTGRPEGAPRGAAPPPGPDERSGDYGYDEAHGF